MVFKYVFWTFMKPFWPWGLSQQLSQLFKVNSHVVASSIQRSIIRVLCVIRLLALIKPYRSIQSIVVHEVIYWLVNRALCLYFCDVFFIHLSPHQFGVAIKGGCEMVVYDVWVILDIHLNQVVIHVDVANIFIIS
jgi:hypothetical protein